jgi:hypothetical protein
MYWMSMKSFMPVTIGRDAIVHDHRANYVNVDDLLHTQSTEVAHFKGHTVAAGEGIAGVIDL